MQVCTFLQKMVITKPKQQRLLIDKLVIVVIVVVVVVVVVVVAIATPLPNESKRSRPYGNNSDCF